MAKRLTLGIAQVALEPTLRQNLAKMGIMIRQAKLKRCDVVFFPESALTCEPETLKSEIDSGLQALSDHARMNGICVAFGYLDRSADERPIYNAVKVFGPEGEEKLNYAKMWDVKSGESPWIFEVKGVSIGAILCADRWLRGVEDLAAFCGSRILVEFSNNFADEWLPDQEWFWYRPRAVRNGVYSVFVNTAPHDDYRDHAHLVDGHGHSAVFAPDGSCVDALGSEVDRLMVCEIDPDLATRKGTQDRLNHPLLGTFWSGAMAPSSEDRAGPVAEEGIGQLSPRVKLTFAAVQMQCYDGVDANMALMRAQMGTAAKQGADVVVFPELAVTGASDTDVEGADESALDEALHVLCASARMLGVGAVFGMPFYDQGKRFNGAFSVDAAGQVLTRYAQTAVDRPHLFTPGRQFSDMWFDLKGVPVAILLGMREALWSELSEMAALRGAQAILHLCHDGGDPLLRRQIWANMASFGTITLTVNAASHPANGGSAIWEDYRRHKKKEPYSRSPYSASRIAEAYSGEEILYTTQIMRAKNPHMKRVVERDPGKRSWYERGAQLIA
ncbi:MAG: carbon-nitrogen hydrolase family protein [bacterium]|nr:carbon-nitrogen hydrolase family protein [bacterium]